MNLPNPPKGSLEDLFRHHLLESEAAAVPPRAHVWEQLDNSLLLAQNAQYRRRLRVQRWAIAASLLLASLASGGWWHSQQQASAPTLAQATSPQAADALGTASRQAAARASYATPPQSANSQTVDIAANAADTRAISSSPAATLAIDQPATFSSSTSAQHLSGNRHATSDKHELLLANATGLHGRSHSDSRFRSSSLPGGSASLAATSSRHNSKQDTDNLAIASSMSQHHRSRLHPASPSATERLAANDAAAADNAAAPEATTLDLATTANSADRTGIDLLAGRMAQLTLANGPHLPTNLTALAQPDEPAPSVTRHWQFGLAYATSAFQPNIDFTKDPGDYNPALGAKSASVTRSAAAEYRDNLRAGLGQRLSVWATHRLGNGRFGLRGSLELTQNTAQSASSMAFVGEQVPDYTQITPTQLQRTTFRYRSAGAAVELRYGNPIKPGFSFYSRVGGLVSALFNVRSEVAGNSEATREYSLQSAASPYRRLSASVRGGAGMQYRPTGHQWALTFGPVAEAGILTLNADPVQDFWHQKRPYSFGLEAGMELGRVFHVQ